MAELVLIQPRMGQWDYLRSNPSLPLGPLHAASYATDEFDVCLVDRRLSPDWKTKLKEAIGPETLAVCFTAYSGAMILDNLEMTREIRTLTDAPVVWGGVHPSLVPEGTVSHPDVDIIVLGEGEITLLELARALKKKESLKGIKGVWFKENGEIVRNPPREFIDFDKSPEIPYRLVDVQKYLPHFQGRKCLYFQSARGCKNKCAFCYNVPFNHSIYRPQSAERTLERLRYAVDNFGVEDVYFVDDNFGIDVQRDTRIAEGIRELGITWQVQGIDSALLKRLDDNFLQILKDSGLRRLGLGVESGCPRVRKLINKPGKLEDIEKLAERLKAYDFTVVLNFMSGIPTETKEELKESVAFMLKLLKISPRFCAPPIFNCWPLPGTPLFELALENGFDPPKSLEEWARVGVQNFASKNGLDREFFESLYFTSAFVDRKFHYYGAPTIIGLLSDIYRPIAKWRVKNLNFKFLVEKPLAEWLGIIFGKYEIREAE